jgi:hypothetical protein
LLILTSLSTDWIGTVQYFVLTLVNKDAFSHTLSQGANDELAIMQISFWQHFLKDLKV